MDNHKSDKSAKYSLAQLSIEQNLLLWEISKSLLDIEKKISATFNDYNVPKKNE